MCAPAGIGKALAKRLADQGLNVVLVALPDDMLDTTHEQLVADYPGLQFRKVRARGPHKQHKAAAAVQPCARLGPGHYLAASNSRGQVQVPELDGRLPCTR